MKPFRLKMKQEETPKTSSDSAKPTMRYINSEKLDQILERIRSEQNYTPYKGCNVYIDPDAGEVEVTEVKPKEVTKSFDFNRDSYYTTESSYDSYEAWRKELYKNYNYNQILFTTTTPNGVENDIKTY